MCGLKQPHPPSSRSGSWLGNQHSALPELSPALLCQAPQPPFAALGCPHTPSLLVGLEPVAWLGQAVWKKLTTFPEDCQVLGAVCVSDPLYRQTLCHSRALILTSQGSIGGGSVDQWTWFGGQLCFWDGDRWHLSVLELPTHVVLSTLSSGLPVAFKRKAILLQVAWAPASLSGPNPLSLSP